MRCASYARAVSNDPRVNRTQCPIGEQTARIDEYIRTRGWIYKKSYSDRKHDPEANSGFLEMKSGACNREFGCIVIDSIYTLGSDLCKSIHYLRETLYPSGIHFAICEDDFCSADHTAEEVYAYLESKRREYFGLFAKERMNDNSVESYFSTYGFRYIKDEGSVIIDEASAAIVREIYERLRSGEKPASIAKDLTERGVENPSDYFRRQRGWPLRQDHSREWNSKSIRTISTNPKYMGKWECGYDPELLKIEAGAIIDPELFEEVQNIIHGRYCQKPTTRKPCPFGKLIFDKTTGLPLRYYNNSKIGVSDIRFNYPKDKSVKYDRTHMLYSEFEAAARQLMSVEKMQALKARDYIKSESGNVIKEMKIQEKRDESGIILNLINEIEEERMEAYLRFNEDQLTEDCFRDIEADCREELEVLFDEVIILAGDIYEVEQIFSEDNPWIRLFASYDEPDELTRDFVSKYADRFLIERFESVALIPNEQKWKDMLPAEIWR